MKKSFYLLVTLLLLLSSCKTKKNLIVRPSLSPLPIDSIRLNNEEAVVRLFAPDHSELRPFASSVSKKDVAKEAPRSTTREVSVPVVVKGTQITTQEKPVPYAGIDRVKTYEFTHRDVPDAFDGFRIAFISDLHYKSLFKENGLSNLMRLLTELHPDILLMGGDYQEGCEYVSELFAALAKVKTPMGTYGVLGNNDYERCHDDIVREMLRYGMHPLEHRLDTLRQGGEQIILAGVRNPFDLTRNGVSPTLALSPKDFVILLVHTPDYAEDVAVTHSDLILVGHTHGGQVRIFGYAPIVPSRYGARFLTGLKYNTAKIPMIVTNGLGTSNRKIRIGAPAEVVLITLHRLKN